MKWLNPTDSFIVLVGMYPLLIEGLSIGFTGSVKLELQLT
jgi:hypothetical protein